MNRKTTYKSTRRATAEIRDALSKVTTVVGSADQTDGIREIRQQLKVKVRDRIVGAALMKYSRSEDLKPYQAELIKMQQHLERTHRKMIVLFEGRDASGKGGTIRRVSRFMNEKRYRVIALGKPNEHQKTELHMKRYVEHFPHAGEIVLFDRSWYSRAMSEPVMGFCTPSQYRLFMNRVVSYERSFISNRKTKLVKLYFSVSREEQARRFERRKNDPLRHWKLSEADWEAQEHWDEFTEKKFALLKKTHTADTPWFIIRSDDKHRARLETMKIILNTIRYRGRSRSLNFRRDPQIVLSGAQEVALMIRHKKKYGRYDN